MYISTEIDMKSPHPSYAFSWHFKLGKITHLNTNDSDTRR